MSPILETSQVITAAFKGIKEYRERSPNGLTKWEVATMVTEMIKPLKDAAVGVQNVHKELLDLDDESKAALLQLIGDHLVEAGVTHRNTDISLSILNWILDGVEVFDFISNLPPTAEPVN